jgi:hypothetical protein
MNRRRAGWWLIALAGLFLFRLLFGLSSSFFGEDETQVFLIGLRYFATGVWPYFGADVVWTRSEIPGALQGVLVGLPMRIWPAPEAPFVLLNLISLASLAALCWYITRRQPSLPRWLVWLWIPTMPWTLQFSTHVINPSYVLPAAVVFFIGFFEALPVFSLGLVPGPIAFAMMGAAVTWILQIHMSYPLLLPYAGLAMLFASRSPKRFVVYAAAFVAGAAVPGLLLVPTWLHYGAGSGLGGTLRNLHVHIVSPVELVTILARFCSFPSLEIVRFIATDNAKRLVFFERHVRLVPFAAVLWTASVVQPLWMVREWFRTKAPRADWTAMKALVVFTIVLVYASYWWVMEPSQAHAFYAIAPVAIVFAADCWTFIDGALARRAAAALLVVNAIFEIGLVRARAPERALDSNRAVVVAAVALKEPEMFAHRRDFAIDPGPLALSSTAGPYDPTRDIQFSDVRCDRGRDDVLLWIFTLTNANPRVAYRDVLYETIYPSAGGRPVEPRHEFVRRIFEPLERQRIEVNDGFASGASCEGASIHVRAAEALRPYPPR